MLDPLAPSTTQGTTQDKTQENKSLKGVDTINKGGIIGSTTTQTGQHKMQKDILVQKAGEKGWTVWDKYSSHESYTLLGFYATNREALDKAFALSSSAQKRNVECHIQIDCTGE